MAEITEFVVINDSLSGKSANFRLAYLLTYKSCDGSAKDPGRIFDHFLRRFESFDEATKKTD
jgi:hypothetical protein